MTAALAHHAAARGRQPERIHAEILQGVIRRIAERAAARHFDAADDAFLGL